LALRGLAKACQLMRDNGGCRSEVRRWLLEVELSQLISGPLELTTGRGLASVAHGQAGTRAGGISIGRPALAQRARTSDRRARHREALVIGSDPTRLYNATKQATTLYRIHLIAHFDANQEANLILCALTRRSAAQTRLDRAPSSRVSRIHSRIAPPSIT